MRTRVMMVDDNRGLVDAVMSSLASERQDWEFEVVSERQALSVLANRPCDVLIADAHTKTSGLLSRVRAAHPGLVRIALSDTGAEGQIRLPATLVSDRRRLEAKIHEVIELKDRIGNPIIARFVSEADILPAPSAAETELLSALSTPKFMPEAIAVHLAERPQLVRRLRKIAVEFQPATAHPDLAQAVSILGRDVVRAIVIFEGVHAQLPTDRLRRTQLANMRCHGYELAFVARNIARRRQAATLSEIEQAFIAGLMHDLGALVLAINNIDEYRDLIRTAASEQRPLIELERKVLGITHAEVGLYLLGLWGLPHGQAGALDRHEDRRSLGAADWATVALYLANRILGDPGEPRGAIETRFGTAADDFNAHGIDAKTARTLAAIRICD